MCGLIGLWKYEGLSDSDRVSLKAGLNNILHRGPEGSSVLELRDFSTAHAHLTFHQPGVSRQPYASPCGRYVLVFNGEIYNFNEIKNDLKNKGFDIPTNSEEELILKLYSLFKENFTLQLRGMFSIVIRDFYEDRIILTRDYIGKKPLFYLKNSRGVFFASELTGLSPFLDHRELSSEAFTSFFLMNAVDSNHCLIAGVKKVGPGEVVTISRRECRTLRYWSAENIRQCNREGIKNDLTALLRRAVARRLQNAGVQFGLMLSGGLDSSLVAALVAENGSSLPSYSARFTDQGFDETPYAAQVAALFCSAHIVVDIADADLPDAAMRYFSQIDEPVADPSYLPVALVAQAARMSCKGLLTGDGADDLFAGYSFFRAVPALTFTSRYAPRTILEFAQRWLNGLEASNRDLALGNVVQLLSRCTRATPEWQHAFATSAFTPEELAHYLKPEARSLATWPLDDEPHAAGTPMRRAQLGLIRSFLQARILTKLDRGSMVHGLELRNPFLDQDVAEFALSLNTEHLIKGSKTKAALRKTAEDFLPQEILSRKKKGFRVPMRRLLKGPLRTLLLDVLSPGALGRHSTFDPAKIELLLHEHLELGIDRSKPLWALLTFNIWQQNFGAEFSVPAVSNALLSEDICG